MRKMEKTSILAGLLRHRRRLALLLLFGLAPLTTSCYGRFPLTRAVYRLNGDVSNDKWIRSIFFWVLVIIPVYWVASFVDAIGLNLIEFWTGERLDVSQSTDAEGNTVTLAPNADGSEARLTVTRDGHILQEGKFVKTEDGNWLILDAEGTMQGKVLVNGADGIEIQDAQGKTQRSLSASDLLRLRRAG